jgi:hypothetical protein
LRLRRDRLRQWQWRQCRRPFALSPSRHPARGSRPNDRGSREPAEAAADQHRVDRGRGQPGPRRDLHRAEPVLPPQVHDLADQRLRGPARRPVRTRRPVGHPVRAQLAVTISPPLSGRPRHVITFSGPGDRPLLIHDQTRQLQTGTRGQGCVSVGHEDLQAAERFSRQLHSTPGGLRPPRSFRSCRHTTSTNVPGQYT